MLFEQVPHYSVNLVVLFLMVSHRTILIMKRFTRLRQISIIVFKTIKKGKKQLTTWVIDKLVENVLILSRSI